ncbi:phage tail protein [Streptomyces anulatus]|uniref:phage tail protein n=1 Tax=Streptomyces anulatus TaxID=1892 RepID=UPI003434F5C2
MGVYELDIYAKTRYGAPLFVAFQSAMHAEQKGYGALEVSWDTPVQAGSSQILAGVKPWTRLRLVRNRYGIPETESDGWVILESSAGSDAANRYLDSTVVPGEVYSYATFVSTAPDTYDPAATYLPGDLASYSGAVYEARQTATGLQPDAHPNFWSITGIDEEWYRCGGCVGLAVRDFRHSELLYDHIPRPYKVEIVESTASTIPVNEQLARFCRVFGFFFDVMKCEHAQLLRMNDVLKCTDYQLSLLAQSMGIEDDLPALPELRRSYVRDAALIQRDRGTASSTARLVKAVTGWDAEVLTGYNAMHDLDESAFASPRYPEWRRDVVYGATAGSQLHSDIVTYNGTLYAAIGIPHRNSVYLSYTGSNPTRTGSGTIVRDPDRVADPYPGYVRLNDAAVGDTLRFTFNAPMGGAGLYTVMLVGIADPAAGIITAAVNGQDQGMAPLDLYSSSRQQAPVVLVGEYTLTTAANTLTLTVTGKNALSTGHAITLSHILIQGYEVNRNIRPVGDPQSIANWAAVAPNSLKDTSTEWNPLTGGYGSWNLAVPNGTVNPDVTATTTPDWWISPQGASVGTASPGSGNSLTYTALTPGTRDVHLAGLVRAAAWDAANTYAPGQAVTWNPLGWATAPVYVAKTQSVGRRPDLNPDKWEFRPYRANSSPEPSRILSDAIHTPRTVAWSATRSYEKGARIAWRGHLYEAARDSLGVYPTGYSTDNLWWRWCGLDTQRYTFSVYHNRSSTATGADVRPYVSWYNSNGVFGGNASVASDAQILFDRFETTPVYPASTGSAPVGYITPAAGQQGVTIPWNYSWGSWANSRGIVRPTTWNTGSTLERRAGRVLWFLRNWVYSAVPPGQTGEQVYATFMSPPDSTQAVMEHGIVVRYSPSAYWLVSRDRLTYTTVTLSGGTVAAVNVASVATWTPIAYGERVRVRNRAADLVVEARGWSGWRTLATVSDTRNNTALGSGLLERVRT